MAEDARFEIHLATAGALGLEAALVNRSGTLQAVLYHADLQPSRLVLKGPAGTEVTPFDERTRRKYDRSVSRAMYVEIPPEGRLGIGGGQFRKFPDGYELRWGPYRFSRIAAGAWTARVTFESRIDWVTDRKTGKRAPYGKVWLGSASSDEIHFELPQ
jgi:hypothetical protein